MRIHFYFCATVLLSLIAMAQFSFAQVHVRGYYRSNGTYVAPHQRTSPNSTVTDNYSYPGNYNPNTGRVTGGNYYPSSTSAGTSNSSNSSSSNYNYGSSANTRSSNAPNSYQSTSTRSYTGSYPYRTTFDNPTILPPLRKSPAISSDEIYSCPKNASVYVIEDVPGSGYCKATVNGYTGYVSKTLLNTGTSTQSYNSYSAPAKQTYSSYSSYTSTSGDSFSTNYKFQTRFDNPTIVPPLRNGPSPLADEIYSCPKNAIVNVIESVNGSSYCKVSINGHVGYISKAMLLRQQ